MKVLTRCVFFTFKVAPNFVIIWSANTIPMYSTTVSIIFQSIRLSKKETKYCN